MGVILLEALGALSALVLIVWWTMFSGRPKGELPASAEPPSPAAPPRTSAADEPRDRPAKPAFAKQPLEQPPAEKV